MNQDPYGLDPDDDERGRPPPGDRRGGRGIDLTSLRIPMLLWVGLILIAAVVIFLAIRPRGGGEEALATLVPTQVEQSDPLATFTPGATSTPPPFDEPTPEPTPVVGGDTLAVGRPAVVGGTGGSGVNMRGGAGLGGPVLLVLGDGTALTLIGGPTEADGFVWWQIRLEDGTEGWVVEDFLAP